MQRDYNGYDYHTFKTKICFSFIEVLKGKKAKLTLTSFYCLGQARWLIGWFIKTYLHKLHIIPVRIIVHV